MNPPAYKHLGEVGAKAAHAIIDEEAFSRSRTRPDISVNPNRSDYLFDTPARTAFARAVIEEHERLRLEEVRDGMPSVEDCNRAYNEGYKKDRLTAFAGVKAVRNLMLSAFAKQLEAANKRADSKHGCWMQELTKATELEAKITESKTVHEWLNKLGIPTEELGKNICLLRRLRITCDKLEQKRIHIEDAIDPLSADKAPDPTPTYQTSDVVKQRRDEAAAINMVMNQAALTFRRNKVKKPNMCDCCGNSASPRNPASPGPTISP